ncbi:MAG: Asp/Glu racemase [Bacteroidota bacterium]
MITQKKPYRIGLIVPSSNTTMETEIPELLRRQSSGKGYTFSFHSSRMRLKEVTPEALRAMNQQSARCVAELNDAKVDAIMYACLVAVMIGGKEGMLETDTYLREASLESGQLPAIISSSSALVKSIQDLKASRISLIAPYKKALTRQVIQTIEAHDITVVDSHSLEVTDNFQVGQLDPSHLVDIARNMDLSQSDALVISACVQMPSLAAIAEVEQMISLPVISAASASVHQLLGQLDLMPDIQSAGRMLSSHAAMLS